jgi:hypothetical protein
MGITCTLWRVSESDLRQLAAQPDQIEEFLFGERVNRRAPAGGGLIGWLKRLSPITIETTSALPPGTRQAQSRVHGEIDLDKAWHGLHFLFTGTAEDGDEPGCFLVRGGEDLGDEEIGNSLPRVLQPDKVKQFATFLSELTADELLRRYDPARMMALEIYPEVWGGSQVKRDAGREYLLEYFQALQEFVRTADIQGEALVVLLT